MLFPFHSSWIRRAHHTYLQHPQHAGAGAAPFPNPMAAKGMAQHPLHGQAVMEEPENNHYTSFRDVHGCPVPQ